MLGIELLVAMLIKVLLCLLKLNALNVEEAVEADAE